MLGTPEWSKNPKYRDRRTITGQTTDEVNTLMIPWMLEHTKEEIFKICQDKRVPCAPIYDISEVINHRQIKAMDFFIELDQKKAGKLKYTKGPCTFEKTDWEWQTAAPLLGQDNEQIYCERLGYSQKELAGMKKSGVI